jgi:outer membrane protein TolC
MEAEELLHSRSAAIARKHVERMQSLVGPIKEKFEAGVASQLDFADAQFSLSEANLLLSQRQ